MERQLECEARVPASTEVLHDVLLNEPAGILASRRVSTRDRCFPVEVCLDASAAAATQEVLLEIGLPDGSTDTFPLSWTLVGHTKLLPNFHGVLGLFGDGEGTLVRISGSYRPPLGRVGAFGDGLVGYRVARSSLEGLVALVAGRLAEEARRRRESLGPRPAPYPASLVDLQLAETWLG